jgi:hypothetical protein
VKLLTHKLKIVSGDRVTLKGKALNSAPGRLIRTKVTKMGLTLFPKNSLDSSPNMNTWLIPPSLGMGKFFLLPPLACPERDLCMLHCLIVSAVTGDYSCSSYCYCPLFNPPLSFSMFS